MSPSFFFLLLEIVGDCENCGSVVADRPLEQPIHFPRHRYRYPNYIKKEPLRREVLFFWIKDRNSSETG